MGLPIGLIACELAVYGGLSDLWGAAFAGFAVGFWTPFGVVLAL